MTFVKINKLIVKTGAKTARFVVDLKKDMPREEISPVSESRLEKLAEVDYGKMVKRGREKAKGLAKNLWIPAFAGMTKEKNARNDRLVDQLAFVQAGKLLFGLIYKICYAVGWTIMFALRLVYFVARAALRPFKKTGYLMFAKSQAVAHKISSEIPAGYQASQAVAMAVSTKVLKKLKERARAEEIPLTPFVKGGLKPVLVFASVLLVIVLPVKALTFYKSLDEIKGRVLGASESALGNLVSAGQAAAGLNFNQANENFSRAGNNFLNAQSQLNEINGLIFSLASVLPDKNLRLAAAGPHILKAGELSAEAGKNLSLAAASLFNQDQAKVNSLVTDLSLYGHNGLNSLIALDAELEKIPSDLVPDQYRKEFILLKQKNRELTAGLKEFIALADNLKVFLGTETDKRYLLVFQNNSELRASGGFIGSYAIVDFSKGRIKSIEAPGGGSYDTDAGLLKKIKSPEPLSVLRPDWHFWDANWWPDWPTSAAKLAWFYENSGGSTVDGVISFTPTVMEKLLRIIGPIDLTEKYGIIFNADNFWLEAQKLSEQKPDVTKQPKKIIGDLMNKLIEDLPKRLSKDNLAELFKITEESLNDKNILFYFADPELQTKAAEMGWDGKIKATAGDYLNVVNTNIAGGKSDREIKQEIILEAEVQPDGSIIDTLIIRRTHNAVKRAPFTGVRNVDWLRVYVPAGSEFLAAGGFKPLDKIFFKAQEESWLSDPEVAAAENGMQTDEATQTKIYQELGKTVFANWSQVDPGETAELTIKYKLPFKLADLSRASGLSIADQLIEQAASILNSGEKNLYSYSLLAQKQPGMNASTIQGDLKLSGSHKIIWAFPGGSLSGAFDQDKLTAVIIEKR